MDIRTELAAELLGTVGRFRRKVRRSGGRPSIETGLPESQAELLQRTLDEEGETDHLLTDLAEARINLEAE